MNTIATFESVRWVLDYFSRDPDRVLPLCRTCSGVSPMATQALQSYVLHGNFQSLLKSSSSCGLCRLVRFQLRKVLEAIAVDDSTEGPFRHASMGTGSRPIALSAHKVKGRVWIETLGLKVKELQWYADPEPLAEAIDLPLAYPKLDSTSLGLLSRSVKECFLESGACSKSNISMSNPCEISEPPLLPRRVIDVGSTRQQNGFLLRLHESTVNEKAHYVTLTHRWGKKISLRTTRRNIKAHCQSIDISSLPNCFKDAVVVTQELGVRYLWIDAICIIQDDLSDWIEQAPLMGKIFQRSYCTIAVHSSKSSDIGFLKSEPSLSNLKLAQYTTSNGVRGTLCVGSPRCFDEVIEQSHIKRRAWVLQELVLSQRTVHFSNGCMYWECPHLGQPRPIDFTADLSKQWSPAMSIPGESLTISDLWLDCVTDYSECELTYRKDKLVAIAGIAAEWQNRFGEEKGKLYHSGLFRGCLPQGLLWYSGGQRLKKYLWRAPSWSWASVDGHIQFMNLRHARIDAKILEVDGSGSIDDTVRPLKLTNQLVMHASTKAASIIGQVSQFGTAGQSFIRPHGAAVKGFRLFDPDNLNEHIGSASLDNLDLQALKTTDCVICVMVYTKLESLELSQDLSFPIHIVLLLEPVGRSVSRYRRIGVGVIYIRGWFNDTQPREIRIV